MTENHYIEDETYSRLVKAIADARLSVGGHATIEDAIKWALGEIAGIWPASIEPVDGETGTGVETVEPEARLRAKEARAKLIREHMADCGVDFIEDDGAPL